MSKSPISATSESCKETQDQGIKAVMLVGFTGHSRLLYKTLSTQNAMQLIADVIWRMTGFRPVSLKAGEALSYQCAMEIGAKGCVRHIERPRPSNLFEMLINDQVPAVPEPFLKVLPFEVTFSRNVQGRHPMPAISSAKACEILHNFVQMTKISEIDITGFDFINDLPAPDEAIQIERLSQLFVSNIKNALPQIGEEDVLDEFDPFTIEPDGLSVFLNSGNRILIRLSFIAEMRIREALASSIIRHLNLKRDDLKACSVEKHFHFPMPLH